MKEGHLHQCHRRFIIWMLQQQWARIWGMLVSSEHIRLHHARPQLMMASLREKYWIPRTRCFQDDHSSLPDLLQVQGEGFTTAHGWATFSSSSTGSTIHNIWHRLCRTHCPTTGINTKQADYQGLHRHICLFCDKGSPHWTHHKPHHWGIPCCLKTFHRTSRKTEGHLFRQRN